jgi:hypothetical protein
VTTREVILHAVEDLPSEYLDEVVNYLQALRLRTAHQNVPTALASESVLARDWLRPEEDEAWRDL